MSDQIDLSGKLLIAMPGMGDPRFEHSVILMCAHSEDGAMGLIINKPTDDLTLADLLDQLSIEVDPEAAPIPVCFGGPVETGRGFVLHDAGYHSSISTMKFGDGFGMTATMDILEDIAQGRGPVRSIIALGYAGWGPSQLEGEIAQNGWLTCDADEALVFDTSHPAKWEAALGKLGVSALTLSAEAGRA